MVLELLDWLDLKEKTSICVSKTVTNILGLQDLSSSECPPSSEEQVFPFSKVLSIPLIETLSTPAAQV